MEVELRIVRAGPERIADLEVLWKALQDHHARIAPVRAGLRARSADAAWERRRPKYEALLATPSAFVLIAERAGRPVGYALVHLAEASHGYESGERVGEVETLSVLGAERGNGIGSALIDAVERELATQGVRELRLSVLAGNDDALRFYERRGMMPFAHVLLGPVGDRSGEPPDGMSWPSS